MEEFVPNENVNFLLDEMQAIETVRKNEHGYKDCHIIRRPPTPLHQRRVDVSNFVDLLDHTGFMQCTRIRLDKESTRSYAHSAIKVHRLGQLKLYFEEKEGLVSRIGIMVGLITSVKEFDSITSFLLKLEVDYDLVIVDWWKKQVIDSDEKLKNYLMEMFK